jgi:hypothetical protein
MHLSALCFSVCIVIHVSSYISLQAVTADNVSQCRYIICPVLPHGTIISLLSKVQSGCTSIWKCVANRHVRKAILCRDVDPFPLAIEFATVKEFDVEGI